MSRLTTTAKGTDPSRYAAITASKVGTSRFYRIDCTMDAIVIRELRVEALIGIRRRERHVMQTLSVDLEMGLPGEAVLPSDKVADTTDDEQVALKIRARAASGQYRLVVSFADRIARLPLEEFGAPRAKVSVAKVG